MTNSKARRNTFRKKLALRKAKSKNIMNRNYNRRNRDEDEDVVAIVNEEFAKNASPEVTKAAILARLDDGCNGDEGSLSFPNQAAKDAAIKADAAAPVSAKHTSDLANARVTG